MKRLVLTGVAALSVLGASAAHAGERECPARQLADGHWNETEVHECMARINGTIEPHETGHWLWKNFPPPEFDKPYEGVLVIEIWPHVDVQEICKSNGPPPYACSVHAKDFKDPQIGTRPACIIF